MIYNVVLVPGVQQSDSVIYIHVYIYSYKAEFLGAETSEYLLIPNRAQKTSGSQLMGD